MLAATFCHLAITMGETAKRSGSEKRWRGRGRASLPWVSLLNLLAHSLVSLLSQMPLSGLMAWKGGSGLRAAVTMSLGLMVTILTGTSPAWPACWELN